VSRAEGGRQRPPEGAPEDGPAGGTKRTGSRPAALATFLLALAVLVLLVSGSHLLGAKVEPVTAPPATASSGAAATTPAPFGPTPAQAATPAPAATPRVLPPAFSPWPWQLPGPTPFVAARPTRVAIPGLRIDLPVVVPARKETFPPCDVAEFLPTFDLPGEAGTTYIYAHARKGMFLPILVASWRKNGRAMIGDEVHVWTDDDRHYVYEIVRVRRHQHSLDWALELPPESLVLQTSETPYATGTKVMLVARYQEVRPATHREAHPKAKPRRCG
jgi:Sortase domain